MRIVNFWRKKQLHVNRRNCSKKKGECSFLMAHHHHHHYHQFWLRFKVKLQHLVYFRFKLNVRRLIAESQIVAFLCSCRLDDHAREAHAISHRWVQHWIISMHNWRVWLNFENRMIVKVCEFMSEFILNYLNIDDGRLPCNCSSMHHVTMDFWFLPRCRMQTRSSDEKFSLSVRLSVCISNAWIVTKQKKNLSRFYTIRKTI